MTPAIQSIRDYLIAKANEFNQCEKAFKAWLKTDQEMIDLHIPAKWAVAIAFDREAEQRAADQVAKDKRQAKAAEKKAAEQTTAPASDDDQQQSDKVSQMQAQIDQLMTVIKQLQAQIDSLTNPPDPDPDKQPVPEQEQEPEQENWEEREERLDREWSEALSTLKERIAAGDCGHQSKTLRGEDPEIAEKQMTAVNTGYGEPWLDARAYLIFGLENGRFTADQVKQRLRELSRKHHPDRGGRAIDMQFINKCHDQLIAEAAVFEDIPF